MRNDLQRAQYGARLLDGLLGPGWVRKIRLRKLKMSIGVIDHEGCGCILAQLRPDQPYGRTAAEIGLNTEALEEGGFDGLVSTEMWLRVPRDRRRKARAPK